MEENKRTPTWKAFVLGAAVAFCLLGSITVKLYTDREDLEDQVNSLQSQLEKSENQAQNNMAP